MSDVDVSVGLLVATQGLAAFNAFMPSLSDIRNGDPSDKKIVANTRTGELGGITVALSFGMMATVLSKSSIPVYCAIMISVVTVAIYESALRQLPVSSE